MSSLFVFTGCLSGYKAWIGGCCEETHAGSCDKHQCIWCADVNYCAFYLELFAAYPVQLEQALLTFICSNSTVRLSRARSLSASYWSPVLILAVADEVTSAVFISRTFKRLHRYSVNRFPKSLMLFSSPAHTVTRYCQKLTWMQRALWTWKYTVRIDRRRWRLFAHSQ